MTATALFIFRRDFRLRGNPAWSRAAAWCRENGAALAPCFLFSDLQTDRKRNPYFSLPAYSAMLRALDALDRDSLGGRLSRFRLRAGAPDTDLLDALARAHDVRAVFFNSDVTPFAVERDGAVRRWCQGRGLHCGAGDPGEGYLLWPAGAVLTKAGTVPKAFSAFERYTTGKACFSIPGPVREPDIATLEPPHPRFEPDGLPAAAPLAEAPGAAEALDALRTGDFDRYGETRGDYRLPTTRLSVHLKFGAVDPADVMRAARERRIPALERQLLWREFYYHLAHGYPETLTAPNSHIRPDRQRERWGPAPAERAEAWLEGETGEPLVDQAMKELARTGYLHNRLRMVVASHFVRDMGMDWREGERLLATRLVDYDPAQNSGGWQAADAQVPGQEIKASAQLKKYGPAAPDDDAGPHAKGDALAKGKGTAKAEGKGKGKAKAKAKGKGKTPTRKK